VDAPALGGDVTQPHLSGFHQVGFDRHGRLRVLDKINGSVGGAG
jgi:hypothetical protein